MCVNYYSLGIKNGFLKLFQLLFPSYENTNSFLFGNITLDFL